jgi:YidC/Oxa1 family membrane protein insertase
MQEVAPRLAEIKEKYKNDREKQAQAQMALYREAGVNPLAGCLPLLIQFPVLIGLYGAIYAGLAQTPLQFVDLTHRLLIPGLSDMLPLKNTFLWMNLGQPDQTMILPILTVVTTWLQMKLTMPPPSDSKDPSAAMSRNMTTIMPLMIGLFSLSFASGLSIYWIVSNVVGIVQYAMMGRVDWRGVFGRRTVTAPAPAAVPVEEPRESTSRSSASRKRELAASTPGGGAKSGSASGRAAERKRSPDAPVSTPRPYTPRKPKTTKAKRS